MVKINGKLLDPKHVELSEPVPPGEQLIQVSLGDDQPRAPKDIALLTLNPSFEFLRDEPDLYD